MDAPILVIHVIFMLVAIIDDIVRNFVIGIVVAHLYEGNEDTRISGPKKKKKP